MLRIKILRSSPQDGSKVKPETIHAHFPVPVHKTVHHQCLHPRVVRVERVSATRVVDVGAWLASSCAVIGKVVDALKTDRGALPIAFTGMVIDHVQDDFDTGIMDGIHHFPEFCAGILMGITGFGCEKVDAVITPIIFQSAPDQECFINKSMYRHQLQRGNTECLQILQNFAVA